MTTKKLSIITSSIRNKACADYLLITYMRFKRDARHLASLLNLI